MKKVLLFGAVGFLIYAELQRKNNNPNIFYRKKLFGNYNGYAAFPIGIFIKESEKDNKMLHDHEMVHWKQFQREGFLPFLLKYGWEALTKGYDANKFEIEARELSGEKEECFTNYTSCVREGFARTVKNTNFRG